MSSPGFDRAVLGLLFVAAVIIDGIVLFFVEPARMRLLYGLLILLPLMWPVVWMTRHFGFLGMVSESVPDKSRKRQFFKLRALTVQFIEEVKRLNWLAVDAKRGVRDDAAVSAEFKAVTRRLHDLVDQMPAAAGFREATPEDDPGGGAGDDTAA